MSVGYSTKFQESVPLVHCLFRSLSLITCHQTANIEVPTQVLTKCNTENLVKLFLKIRFFYVLDKPVKRFLEIEFLTMTLIATGKLVATLKNFR